MPTPLFDGRAFAAFLFDMDGTLLTSTESAERVWSRWGRRHGLDVASFLPKIHGVRTIETMRNLDLPGLDPEAEAAWITRAEIEDTDGIHPIAGAARFLSALPAGRWAIVTSASRDLAAARLAAAGMPPPPLLLTADDVTRGKPDPQCFERAAERLGVAVADCLVFEDAAAGVAAAEAARAAVVVLTATHDYSARRAASEACRLRRGRAGDRAGRHRPAAAGVARVAVISSRGRSKP